MKIENMSAAELTDYARDVAAQIKLKHEQERNEALKALQAKLAAENAAHRDRMFSDIGQPLASLNQAQHDAVYAMAWVQGHSSGYGEVEVYYGEFAELARKILEAK